MTREEYWAKCSTCKKGIPFGSVYYICSVSTCRHKRKGFRFCSVPCWDGHLGFMNHREAYAEEVVAPKEKEIEPMSEPATPITPMNDDSGNEEGQSSFEEQAQSIQSDTLVVVSKVKKLIKEQSTLNTSQCFIDGMTKKVIAESLRAVNNAKNSGRKTVMGRDLTC